MSTLERRIVWGIVIGVVVYAGVGLAVDAGALADHLAGFPWRVFGLALGLVAINYAIRFGKWQFYLRLLGVEVPVLESLTVFLAGLSMAVTPGKLGEVLKSVLLRESRGVPAARTAPVVLAERVTDLFGLVLLGGFGVAAFDYGRWAFVLVVVALGAGIAVVQRPRLVGWILDRLERVPGAGRLRPKIEEAYASTRAVLGWKALLVATALSALGWSMEGLAFYHILGALDGHGVTIDLAFFVFAVTTLLGALSFLPGGLGVTEGSMIGVLVVFGVFAEEAQATAATYLIRFATLWFAVVVGLIALGWFRARYGAGEAGDSAESP